MNDNKKEMQSDSLSTYRKRKAFLDLINAISKEILLKSEHMNSAYDFMSSLGDNKNTVMAENDEN